MYCRKCGKEIVENGKFCGRCGTAVQYVTNQKKPQPIEIKEEIIELPEEKIDSLKDDKTIYTVVAGTMVLAIALIIGISLL